MKRQISNTFAPPASQTSLLRGKRLPNNYFIDMDDLTNGIREEPIKMLRQYRAVSEVANIDLSVVEDMIEGLQVLDFDWTYLYVNNAVVRQIKKTREELLGHTLIEIFPDVENTNVFSALKKCMEERTFLHFENEFTYSDGTVSWFELSIQPAPQGILILSVDITDRKKAEAEIKKLNEELELKVEERTALLTELNKELESFSYSVSHDLRAPLRVINGYLTILEENQDARLDESIKTSLKRIRNNVEKMDALIHALLAFAKLGRKEVRKIKVNMKMLAENIAQDFKAMNPHKAEILIGNLDEASADAMLIKQVFINLLSNAIKYSTYSEAPRVEIDSYKKDGTIVYSFRDNGVGFDMTYADKLFGIFQRMHPEGQFEGTGVGLAIVQRIINKHGGKVWAEGKPGEGAVFYFSLPE
ncbi:sensor histidine kinase [Nitrosomonas sp. Is37]|uniref:sensor histidine kinase n=1 Tax=Nitrosomonas sp. Is37 TaxID=3080535 RepID=UPI00294B32AF|nr:ATP-binding protein [Nitrosomonas sp. Is37]MDV6345708.1 ATP-binding protein [Nitrosomonas sp. Is37]